MSIRGVNGMAIKASLGATAPRAIYERTNSSRCGWLKKFGSCHNHLGGLVRIVFDYGNGTTKVTFSSSFAAAVRRADLRLGGSDATGFNSGCRGVAAPKLCRTAG